MYRELEDLYKKQSPYNKIKRKIFCIYIVTVTLLLLFNNFNNYVLMTLIIFILLFVMKNIIEKELNIKLYLSLKKEDNDKTIEQIIDIKEKILFKQYLKRKNLYNTLALKCIMNHYRNLIKPKMVNDSFWAIIAIIVSILIAFITPNGFDFNSFQRNLPYLFYFAIIIIIFYLFIKRFSEVKIFIKGEDGMLERLETIFSELYIESTNTSTRKRQEKTSRNKMSNLKKKKTKKIKNV